MFHKPKLGCAEGRRTADIGGQQPEKSNEAPVAVQHLREVLDQCEVIMYVGDLLATGPKGCHRNGRGARQPCTRLLELRSVPSSIARAFLCDQRSLAALLDGVLRLVFSVLVAASTVIGFGDVYDSER